MTNRPSLTDFESLMKAADYESSLMLGQTTEVAQIITSADESKSNTTADQLPKIPSLDSNITETQAVNMADEVKSSLNNTNISAILNRLASNPEEVGKVMQDSMGQMTPEMMEKARKLAMGGQGQQIMREMQRRGMDPNAMRTQLMEQQKALRGLNGKVDNTKKVILITSSRQLKVRNIPIGSAHASASSIIKTFDPVELSCSRLATGPLSGKTIKVWCDPQLPGRNKRLSKLVGFPVAGEGLVVMEEGDLIEKDFLAAEKNLA